MSKRVKEKNRKRQARHWRIRSSVSGTPERPRVAVHRTSKHIYVQVIDDIGGHTLLSVSTLTPAVKQELEGKHGGNVAAASVIGKKLAERAKEKGITKVCFDRGGNRFHGRVKALATAAREAGLEF